MGRPRHAYTYHLVCISLLLFPAPATQGAPGAKHDKQQGHQLASYLNALDRVDQGTHRVMRQENKVNLRISLDTDSAHVRGEEKRVELG